MADPKYAKLPGIDLNSPDVYETNELPESEQGIQSEQEELPNEAIEKVELNTDEAYKKFKGKGVHGKDIDFSDKITVGRRMGYEADDYELAGEGEGKIETPQQKFQRLQSEIRELTEEVSRIKENVKSESADERLSPVQLGKQLSYLQHQLTDLHLEKLLGPEASIDLSDPQGALQKRLLTQLESFKPDTKQKAPGKEVVASSGDHVTYELFYRPEQAQFSRNAKLASLEERLERLEAAMGNTNQDKLGLLTADTDNKSLVGAVAVVNSKLSLLEATNIEQVEVRLHSVLQKLDKIAEKKNTQEDAEKQNKISELYGLVKKWEATADVLPKVVDRLSALKDLHEQALQFSQALTYLDTTQQEITASLKSHGDMLKQMQGVMSENVTSIKNNCTSIDTRISSLK
ncbi:dynactin subunit 2-like [Mya arenaria]|uniref:dynactin subunit 2-like n=1 Tax=Mya arenaria TaxID=6604 RepID=UPI0022E1BE43|nr:dynactin subunit 2-like [Mya arenaria]